MKRFFHVLDGLSFLHNNRWFGVSVLFGEDINPKLKFALKNQQLKEVRLVGLVWRRCKYFWRNLCYDHRFVPKLLFRNITKQEEKSLRYYFVESGGRTWKMLAISFHDVTQLTHVHAKQKHASGHLSKLGWRFWSKIPLHDTTALSATPHNR